MGEVVKRKIEILSAWLLLLIFTFVSIVKTINVNNKMSSFSGFEISDWLINYEGGFVRRGLLGQILFKVSQFWLLDLKLVILCIIFIFSSVSLLLVLHIFIRKGWSLLIIPTGSFFGWTFFNIWSRRDFISLLLVFFIFRIYKQIDASKYLSGKLALFYVFSIAQLLIHEASFFYTFPILMLYYFCEDSSHISFTKRIISTLLLFSPILITLIILSFFHGNLPTAIAIWNSWGRILPDSSFSDLSVYSIGKGVEALTWSITETGIKHIKGAFLGYPSSHIWKIPIVLFNILSAYYLITRVNKVNMGLYKRKELDNISLSNIVIIQFIFMLPMFTFLSCDWGRTIPYWLISSIFFFYYFENDFTNVPSQIQKVSKCTQKYIQRSLFLSSQCGYIFLVLITPFCRFYAPDFTYEFHNTLQTALVYNLLEMIYSCLF